MPFDYHKPGSRYEGLIGPIPTRASNTARQTRASPLGSPVLHRSPRACLVRNMYQNLLFAFVYIAAGVPVAAGVLYPFLGILLSPLFAAAAMSLSSVSVVGNALRLRRA